MFPIESWKTIILIEAVLEVLIEHLNKNFGEKSYFSKVFL